MEFDFLKPTSEEVVAFISGLNSQHLGSKMVLHTNKQFPDINKIKIAIIGVLDNRGDSKAISDVDLTPIRKELYSLYPGNWEASIADLGDIEAGNSIEDTYFALRSVVSNLIKNKIIPIVIGGTQDLTYSMYRAYDDLEQMVNLVAIDSKFDLGKESDPISSNSYLTKIIVEEPNNLFNYCNIGYQTFYNSQEEIDLIEKLFFDAYRLGDVCNNIAIAEPVFRDADLVSLDLGSIKSSDSQVLDEIYNILSSVSLDSDIKNYHSHTENNIKFLSLFFDGDSPRYEDFLIEWAYIESCEKLDDTIFAKIYSYNGNLSIWKEEIVKKYKNRFLNPPYIQKYIDLEISIFIEKSVRFKNYDVQQDWIEAEAPEPILHKKKKN